MEECLDKTTVASSMPRANPGPAGSIADRVLGYWVVFDGNRICRPVIPRKRAEAREYGHKQSNGGKAGEAILAKRQALSKATDKRSAERPRKQTHGGAREAVGTFVNSPREEVEFILEYRNCVWRTDDVELRRARNVHQDALESEEPLLSRRLSVHDHREGNRFEGLLN